MSLILNGDTGISAVDGTASAPALVGNDTDTGVYFSAANTLDFATSGTRQASISSAGLFQFNSGYGSVATAYGCRAWVNFNGTGTVAIRASGNVTSITDDATGSYTVNFTNAMTDVNYSTTGSTNGGGGRDTNFIVGLTASGTAGTYSTTAVQVLSYDIGAGVAADSSIVSVAIFR